MPPSSRPSAAAPPAPVPPIAAEPGAERVIMLDQRELPERELYHELRSVDEIRVAHQSGGKFVRDRTRRQPVVEHAQRVGGTSDRGAPITG